MEKFQFIFGPSVCPQGASFVDHANCLPLLVGPQGAIAPTNRTIALSELPYRAMHLDCNSATVTGGYVGHRRDSKETKFGLHERLMVPWKQRLNPCQTSTSADLLCPYSWTCGMMAVPPPVGRTHLVGRIPEAVDRSQPADRKSVRFRRGPAVQTMRPSGARWPYSATRSQSADTQRAAFL